MDLAAYRVVQEALTNALKHAGPARAASHIRYEPDELLLEVSDDGVGTARTADDLGGGHGLVGMRERVALYGGELETGPAPRRRLRGARPDPARAEAVPMSVRVLLVDDQALIRAGFRMILEAEEDIDVVGECADGTEALDSAKRLAPRRGADGHPHARDGRHRGHAPARRSTTPDAAQVLMLTTFDLDEYVYDALRAGASGFLLKDVPADQLVEGIRVVAGGDALLAPSVTSRLIREFSRTPPVAARAAAHARGPHAARARGLPAARARDVERRDRGRARGVARPR